MLEFYFLPGDLKPQIGVFVVHDNHHRHHECLGNLRPSIVYPEQGASILKMREEIKKQTIQKRGVQQKSAAA